MSLRGDALMPFSIQAILNRKDSEPPCWGAPACESDSGLSDDPDPDPEARTTTSTRTSTRTPEEAPRSPQRDWDGPEERLQEEKLREENVPELQEETDPESARSDGEPHPNTG